MLNLMEPFPLAGTASTAPGAARDDRGEETRVRRHAAYIGDPRLAHTGGGVAGKDSRSQRAKLLRPAKAACDVEPSVFDGLTTPIGGDTIYLSVIDRTAISFR